MHDDDRLLTARQAAEVVGVKRGTLAEWSARGAILPRGRVAGREMRERFGAAEHSHLFRLGDVRALAATSVNPATHDRHAPAGYCSTAAAAERLRVTRAVVLKMLADGRLGYTAHTHGKRTYRWVEESSLREAVARAEEAERRAPRADAAKDEEQATDPITMVDRCAWLTPLDYAELARRRERFELRRAA